MRAYRGITSQYGKVQGQEAKPAIPHQPEVEAQDQLQLQLEQGLKEDGTARNDKR